MDSPESPIILDACCILNFYVSGHFLEILRAINAQFYVTLVVKDQELGMLEKLENEETPERNLLEMAIAEELIQVIDFESEEEAELFVNYAFQIDDGEAASFVIAVSRGWAIATDDRRAISLIKSEVPFLQILSTLDLIKYWSEAANLNSLKLREALEAIQVKGRYRPRKSHLLYSWWELAINLQ
ncbi:MAG: hypothetical protein ACOVQ7_27985 [Limnoraphis robusta]|jgi:predicted nucleic acid-binding protein